MENARESLYLIVMTHSEVHIQRVRFELKAPVLIDLVLPNSRNENGNLECEKGLLLFKSNRKAMNRNWSNQKANPALKTKTGNK